MSNSQNPEDSTIYLTVSIAYSIYSTSHFGVCLTSHMFTGHLRSPHPFCVLGNHVPEATARTRNTLSSTVSSTYKYSRTRLALLSLCLFRYALPLAAFVVDAALLVGSMIFFVSYEFICNVHDAYTRIAA